MLGHRRRVRKTRCRGRPNGGSGSKVILGDARASSDAVDHSGPLELFLVESLRGVEVAFPAGSFDDEENDEDDSNKGEENADDTTNNRTCSGCTGRGVG